MSPKDQLQNTVMSTESARIINQNLIPVSVAAVLDRAVFHPMETVITIRQDSGKKIPQIIGHLYASGFRSFYPGYFPAIISAIPVRTSIYSTYLLVKEYGEKYTTFTPTQLMAAGGLLSGVAEAGILCPSESYRTRKTLKIQIGKQFRLSALYSGFFPLVMRTSLENTICLMGSDLLLQKFPESTRKNFLAVYFTGLVAGVASQIIGGPIDVIKTRVMKSHTKNIGIKQHVADILRERGLFRSVGLRSMRAGICNSMMLGTTVVVQKLMHDTDDASYKKEPSESGMFRR